MNLREGTTSCLKKQSILILEKPVPKYVQESDPQKCVLTDEDGAFILNKTHQTIQEKKLLPGKKCFDLGNSYFEFCLLPKDSNNDSYLTTISNSEKVYERNCINCREEKQPLPLQIIKNASDFFEANLPNGLGNKIFNISEETNVMSEKTQSEAFNINEKTCPKENGHENGEANSPMLEESYATTKNIVFKPDIELGMKNPYLEFILKSERSESHLSENGNSEEPSSSNSGIEKKINGKGQIRNKKAADIFGNHLTSKDKNKIKVICPHCAKKVPAPGFVRHLSYCMKARLRKTRRS